MGIPRVSRPYMPGYGIAGPAQGSGLLHWSWAAERLTAARNYWVVSTWPDGRPHTMPVWGMWDDSTLWFTSATGSRKVKNLRADPRCCVTTEDASDPVIIEGTARFATDQAVLRRVVDLMNAKYHSGVDLDFLNPEKNATIGGRPQRVFSMLHSDFARSPTGWAFDEGRSPPSVRGPGAGQEPGRPRPTPCGALAGYSGLYWPQKKIRGYSQLPPIRMNVEPSR